MIKRLFGMHHLNITQGRYDVFSHKKHNAYDLAGSDSGIDYYKATSPLKVIGIHRFNVATKQGFANTIMFYDEENDITLAMTHMNVIGSAWYVGKTFKPGEVIYLEGTTGMANGNHIHLEIAKGFQAKKKRFNGIWGLNDWVNFEDYFYINDSITVVNCPYQIEKVTDRKGLENMDLTEIKEGLSKDLSIKGYKMHLYGISDSEDVCVESAKQRNKENWEALQTLGAIDNGLTNSCKINGGFFDLHSGQHYGVEISHINKFIPRKDAYLVFYEYMENGKKTWNWCGADSFDESKNNLSWALTPFAIINKYGQIAYSVAYNSEYNRKPHSRSIYMWLKTGKRAMGVITSDIDIPSIYECFKNVAEVIAVFDGGGSTQMKAFDGRAMTDVFRQSRLLANAICAYVKDGTVPRYNNHQETEKQPDHSGEKEDSEKETLKKENILLKIKLANIRKIVEGN